MPTQAVTDLEADLLAALKHRVEQVVELVSLGQQVPPHQVVDVQQVVGVLPRILDHLQRQGPGQDTKIQVLL